MKEKQPPFEKIMEDRVNIKKKLEQTLRDKKFTEVQMREIFSIIDNSEAKITLLKSKLVGTNIGMECQIDTVNKIQNEITKETKAMHENLQNKLKEIIERNSNK